MRVRTLWLLLILNVCTGSVWQWAANAQKKTVIVPSPSIGAYDARLVVTGPSPGIDIRLHVSDRQQRTLHQFVAPAVSYRTLPAAWALSAVVLLAGVGMYLEQQRQTFKPPDV